MKTETLIRELARSSRPVRPLSHPLVRFAWWLGAAAACVALGVVVIGIRDDLASICRRPAFVVHTVSLIGLAVLCAMAAFRASVPDRRNPWWALLPIIALSCWSILLAWALFSEGHAAAGAGIKCIRNIVVLSLPPGLLLYVMLRRAAPLARSAIGVLASLGVAALANVGTRFVCHNDSALHVLVWHFVTVLALGALGSLLGRLSFRG